MKTARLLLVLSAACTGLVPLRAQEDISGQAAELLDYELPPYPIRAQMDGVFEGEVEALVDIDAAGKVIDFLVLSSTNEHFVAPIERVIYDWVFTPATRGGESVASIKPVSFEFEYGRFINANIGNSITQAYLNEIRPDRGPIRFVAKLSELDALPVPLEIERPRIYEGLPEGQRSGRMVFEFFIDREGRVRMPLLTEYEGDLLLAEAATAALEKWRFEPPRSKGRPVIAHVRQEFIFTAD